MLAKHCLLAGALALQAVSSLMFDPDWPLGLILKRQDDMSEAEYNCHDNCGQAIIAGRGTDPCNDDTFEHDYDACLRCAGSDNVGIWKYYGGSLTSVAASCSLSTLPLTGTQAAVSAAMTAASAASASATSTAATATTASASGSTAAATASSGASGTAGATATATTTTASSTASSSAAASASATGGASSTAFGWSALLASLSVMAHLVSSL